MGPGRLIFVRFRESLHKMQRIAVKEWNPEGWIGAVATLFEKSDFYQFGRLCNRSVTISFPNRRQAFGRLLRFFAVQFFDKCSLAWILRIEI